MCGGVVLPYANAETETWNCPCVPPPALHAERSRSPRRYLRTGTRPSTVRQLHRSIESNERRCLSISWKCARFPCYLESPDLPEVWLAGYCRRKGSGRGMLRQNSLALLLLIIGEVGCSSLFKIGVSPGCRGYRI